MLFYGIILVFNAKYAKMQNTHRKQAHQNLRRVAGIASSPDGEGVTHSSLVLQMQRLRQATADCADPLGFAHLRYEL